MTSKLGPCNAQYFWSGKQLQSLQHIGSPVLDSTCKHTKSIQNLLQPTRLFCKRGASTKKLLRKASSGGLLTNKQLQR